MYRSIKVLFISSILLIATNSNAEGTKELCPTSVDKGYIQVYDQGRTFATYNCNADERLNIHISNTKEKIYFGFGTIWDTDGSTVKTDLYYRIKNQNGVTVYSARLTPNIGIGYISSYAKAVAGPSLINPSGYPALAYSPVDTGDYYIEFNPTSANTVSTSSKVKRMISLFDITVIDTVALVAKSGRLWSKTWDFSTNSASNGFMATMFIYSQDGIVTSLNFNGIQPWGFTMSCNSTGCKNTGNIALDRKSISGNFTYADYKIFLNNPDIKVYPNGVPGSLNTNLSLSGCAPNYCINVMTDAPGDVEFFVNLNGIAGYQIGTRDLLFSANVLPGSTCIPWDGKDGLGFEISQNLNFEILTEYKYGLTNLPMYDVENFSGGFIVQSVRPFVNKPTLFWDDLNLSGGTANLVGCTNSACHPWPSANFGNLRTINTWWYVKVASDTIVTIIIPKPTPNIIGNTTSCDSTILNNYSTTQVIGNTYLWESKKGTIISGQNSTSISLRLKYGTDTLTVLETNEQGCFRDSIFLIAYPTPAPIISGDAVACDINTVDSYNVPLVNINTYLWSINGGVILTGQGTNNLSVRWTTLGPGSINLVETNPVGCFKSINKNVNVAAKPVTSTINH